MPGQTLSGIDVEMGARRRGYYVEGRIAVSDEKHRGSPLLVELRAAQTSEVVSSTMMEAGRGEFYFGGVADGEYTLTASLADASGAGAKPTKISVRGSDLRGVRLVIPASGSLIGTVAASAVATTAGAPDCRPRALDVRRIACGLAGERAPRKLASPAADGRFEIDGLDAGEYRAVWDLPDERWYVQSITLPSARGAAVLKASFRLGQGQQVAGVAVTVAEGGAVLTGKVEGLIGAEKREVVLIPEGEAADQPWSYALTEVDVAGNFKLKQVAPGKYRAVVRKRHGPDFWSEPGRQALKKMAGQPVEAKVCGTASLLLGEAK